MAERKIYKIKSKIIIIIIKGILIYIKYCGHYLYSDTKDGNSFFEGEKQYFTYKEINV